MKPAVSIIMPYFNDAETAMSTIESLYLTIDIDKFELIVIDDGSSRGDRIPDDYKKPNMIHHRQFMNMGVGQAFDAGVNVASGDTIILMGSDIRFLDNGWASRMLRVVSNNPQSLVCATCGSTLTDTTYYGADLIFLVENKDLGPRHPRKGIPEYRSILEGKWRPRTGRGVYQVPCLMGAFYGVSKEWYQYIRGFDLHYKWGALEPLISTKSWLLGGNVLVDTDNKTLHMFNRRPRRMALWNAVLYNQLIVASTSFGDYGIKYANFLSQGHKESWQDGSNMYMDKIESVNQVHSYLHNPYWDEKGTLQPPRAVMTPEELETLMIDMSYHYHQDKCKYTDPKSV